MVDLNNPADRLEHWLLAARNLPHNELILKQWCNVWELDFDDPLGRAECMVRAGELVGLGVEVRQRAERIEPMGPQLLSHYGEIEETLSRFGAMSTNNLDHFFGSLGETGLASLSNIKVLLSMESASVELSEADQASLLKQTRDLIDAVIADPTLTEAETELLVKRLRDVETVLLRIDLSGADKAAAAVDGLTGVLVRFSYRGVDFLEHPVTRMVFALVTAISLAIGIPTDMLALQAGVRAALAIEAGDGNVGAGGGGGGASD